MIQATLEEGAAILQTILPRMFIGMVLAGALFSMPEFRKVTALFERLARVANLKSGVPVAAFFADRYAALSILAEMRRRGAVSDREVMVCAVMGMFPMGIRSTLLVMGPLALSSLGAKYGLAYILLDLTSKLLVSLTGALAGRMYLEGGQVEVEFRMPVRESVVQSVRQFLRVAAVLIPSVFAVLLVVDAGMNRLPLNTAQLAILSAGAGSTIAGIGVAGSLVAKGVVSGETALLHLIVAQMLHRVVEGLRSSMPVNVSMFGASLGSRLTAVTFIAGEVACLISLGILLISTSLSVL
ncbi:Uncharacterized protein conserved in archaea [Geoglobus ahangari]|uniref:Uncharacterized protein conserved in archaea n=1 Tax=Geoglobus ahangari TaxID=113653 RepID=A0A0F7IH85_9EURY|nr:hypothetical protein [Geoglobus ahangari]AKG91363.1 Uncharacterized protein conserved in archaea [Geoglobus ahangari]